MLAQEERPDAEPVAGQDQGLVDGIPERDRELAVEPCERIGSPLLPGVDDHLGVAPGPEAVSQRGQLLAELHVVVDLAVEDHPDPVVLAGEGLLPRGQVDDRQAGVAQRRAPVTVEAALVRPAVPERGDHRLEVRELRRRRCPGQGDGAGDPAHAQEARSGLGTAWR